MKLNIIKKEAVPFLFATKRNNLYYIKTGSDNSPQLASPEAGLQLLTTVDCLMLTANCLLPTNLIFPTPLKHLKKKRISE